MSDKSDRLSKIAVLPRETLRQALAGIFAATLERSLANASREISLTMFCATRRDERTGVFTP
jgi:hypothetical protein